MTRICEQGQDISISVPNPHIFVSLPGESLGDIIFNESKMKYFRIRLFLESLTVGRI